MGCPQEAVQLVINAYPEAIVIRTKKGTSARHFLSETCPHRMKLEALLDDASKRFNSSFADPFSRRSVSCARRLEAAVFV